MLKNYIKLDIKRAFFNWKFPACSLVVCLLLMYNGSFHGDVISWIAFNGEMLFLLIAMAVASGPYVASYVEDSCHKFKIQMELRGNNRDSYMISRICIVFLSAMITFFLGFVMAIIIQYFKLGMPSQEDYEQLLYANVAYGGFIFEKNYMLYFFFVTLHISVMSGVMSLMGLLLSQLVNNRIAAYCFPMLFVYIQDILIQRIFGWEKGAGITLKCIGINQLSSVLPGQGIGKYYFQIVCYMIIICYFINYINKRKLNE